MGRLVIIMIISLEMDIGGRDLGEDIEVIEIIGVEVGVEVIHHIEGGGCIVLVIMEHFFFFFFFKSEHFVCIFLNVVLISVV